MNKFLAQNEIFGTFKNPAPIGDNPSQDLGRLMGVGIYLVFVVGGIVALVYMLWGAVNYITSGGDKERLAKARQKIINAVIGIFLLVIVFAVFVTIFQFVLGGTIFSVQNGSIQFHLPSLGSPATPCKPLPGQTAC